MNSFSNSYRELQPEQVAVINRICDAFEQAWKGGLSPEIEDYLATTESIVRRVLMHELVLIDAAYREALETQLATDRYEEQFPEIDCQWLRDKVAKLLRKRELANRVESPLIHARYEILGEIGRGGMGIVYKARDQRLGRLVCLKLLQADSCRQADRLTRFEREARIVGSLNHPNICTLFELESVDGRPFLVLEWIEGRTFRSLALDGCEPTQVQQYAIQVARALEAAHGAGIMHRDIKPENLMVRPDGLVKVLDFGLARLVELSETAAIDDRTAEMVLLGTVKYMSPEQARSQPASAATDIFSLGVVLYELVTRQHPFPGAHVPAILNAIIEDEPPSPCAIQPAIDARFGALIGRMLTKSPELRPSAFDVVTALNELTTAGNSLPSLRLTESTSLSVVGRELELSGLFASASAVAGGKATTVFISGEPGIGKTTVIECFIESVVHRQAFVVLHGRCSQRLSSSDAYLPVLDAITRLLAGPHHELMESVMAKSAPAWRAMTTSSTDALTRATFEAGQLTPGRFKREFRGLLEELSRLRPVLFVLDDLHWADESTVDLLGYVTQEITSLRVLIVGSYRKSDAALSNPALEKLRRELTSHGVATELALSFLNMLQIQSYVDLVMPGHRLPESFTTFLHRRTEGNPFFLHGLVGYLKSCGVLKNEDGRWSLTQSPEKLGRDLPGSIASLIESMLARLSAEDLQILQVASVQGMEFDGAVVADALQTNRAEIEERFQSLEQLHGLVTSVGEVELPDGTLTLRHRFVHILFHEAFYSGIAPARRVAWSLGVAQVLVATHGRSHHEIAHVLAFLFEAGRDFLKALEYIMMAAKRDVLIGANREAARTCRRGLELLHKISPRPEYDQIELGLQSTLGFAEAFSVGYGTAETLVAYKRAEELCLREPANEQQFAALHGLWVFYLLRMDPQSLVPLSDRLVELATKLGSVTLTFAANANRGVALLHQGQLRCATKAFQEAWDIKGYTLADDRRFVDRMCVPFGTICRGLCSWLWHLLGRDRDAMFIIQLSIEHGDAIGVPQFRVQPWHFRTTLCYMRCDAAEAIQWSTRTVEYSLQYGLEFFFGLATVIQAWAVAALEQGDLAQRRAHLETARAVVSATQARGVRLAAPLQMCVIGETLAMLGQYEEALNAFETSLAIGQETGEQWWEAETLRQIGLLNEHALRDASAAKMRYRAAVDLAHRQGALQLECRSLVDLARLTPQKGERDEILQRLSEVVANLPRDNTSSEMIAARALLI